MKVYLDNCCFNRPFDDQSQLKINLETQAKLEIQKRIFAKEYDLVWSYMLEYENMQNPFEIRKESIIKWKDIAKECVLENDTVLTNAEKLLTYGFKAKDSIHIACAEFANCDYFLTTDIGILKKRKYVNMSIVSPIEFINEESDDNDEN